MKGEEKRPTIHRRKFVGNSIKLAALGTLLMPLAQACNNKKAPGTPPTSPDTSSKKKGSTHSKKTRKKWNYESLVMNSKTKVMHFPTSKIYTYYDEIKASHLQAISLATWANQLQEAVRLNKEKSGNIIEILTLQSMNGNVNDTSFVIAIDTLSMAFTTPYEKANTKNFRLHELMLQFVVLNNAIPADQKWITFNSKVKKPARLRKRQKWMETETAFNERVGYILNHQNDYMTRLKQRAAKYTFT